MKNKTEHLISIITPNFNKGDYIEQTIQSVIAQSYSNWELLIIDDGSTDHSLNIIKKYTAKDSRVRFFLREQLPKGGSVCRNIGLEKAKGNWVFFLDSDDLITPNCLENRLGRIKQHPDHSFYVFPTGTFYEEVGDSLSQWIPPKQSDYLKLFLRHDLPWNISGLVWEIEYLKSLHGFKEHYPRLQDVELHTRALIYTSKYKVFSTGSIDFFYRIAPQRSKTIYNEERYITLYLEASQYYLKDMKKALSDNNKSKSYFSSLRGTYFVAINRVLTTCYRLKKINTSFANEKIELFRKQTSTVNPSIFNRLIISIYIQLYKLGFGKVKGFNFVLKKIYCL